MKKQELILISISLTKDGIKWNEYSCEAEEKKLVYIIKRKFEYDNTIISKHIKKEELFNITTNVINSTNQIIYRTYCYPNDIEQTKERLLRKVKLTASKFKNEIDSLMKFL